MQQTVLLTAIRGPDGVRKDHPVKIVLRVYRRLILLSALDGRVLGPFEEGGGNFTGPCLHKDGVSGALLDFRKSVDDLPHHFLLHLIHAIEIVGYKYPNGLMRTYWTTVYAVLCRDLHMTPETEEELDFRLGDDRANWLKASDTPIGNTEK